jgi:hypothetical protein
MNSGFFPKVVNPNGYKLQTQSVEFQKPFFFGGSQVPITLGLHTMNYGKGLPQMTPQIHKGGVFRKVP